MTQPRLIRLVHAAALSLFADAGIAATPLPFDSYIVGGVNGGDITADCTHELAGSGITATCSNITSDNGFLQREVVVSGYTGANASLNGRYIQFIVTEPGVTGEASADPFTTERGNLLFSNEDFVKMNNRGDGLASKLTIIESKPDPANPDLEERYVSSHTFNIGTWAVSGNNPFMDTFQEISQIDYSGIDPIEIFRTRADITVYEKQLGSASTSKDIGLSQYVDLDTTEGPGKQYFQYKLVNGQYQTTSRTGDGSLLPGGTNGGDINWASQDKLSATWVGQTLTTNTAEADRVIGSIRYRNLTTPQETRRTSLSDPEAQGWSMGPFGPVASLTDPKPIVTATATVGSPGALQPTVAVGTPSSDPTVVTLPVQYNDWEVSNGVFFNVGCPSGAVCYPPTINEQGIYQRAIVVAGVEYTQTIVTESDATGNAAVSEFLANSVGFRNETIVRRDDTVRGVAGNLQIAERDLAYADPPFFINPLPTTAGEFVYNNTIKTGWAHGGPLDSTMVVDQRVTVPDYAFIGVSGMENLFHMEMGDTEADKKMDMTVAAGWTGWSFPITFSTSKVQGAYQNTSHTAGTDPDLLPSNAGDISWSAGDAIQVTWIGARYAVFDPFVGVDVLRSTSYTNLSTGERTVSNAVPLDNTMLLNMNPESWVSDPFGDAPVYMDPYPATTVP